MAALGTTYIMSSAALFLALEDREATLHPAGSSRDAAAATQAEPRAAQVASSTIHPGGDADNRNVPIRFRRYLRVRPAENSAPSGSRDDDVGGTQSRTTRLQPPGSNSTAVIGLQGGANAPDVTEPRVPEGEASKTNGSRPSQPKNKRRSRSHKAGAQPSDGAAATKEKAEPTRRSKRIEGRKAPTPETTSGSDSQSGPSTPSMQFESFFSLPTLMQAV